MIFTLFRGTLITFLVIQLAPGSPVESRVSIDQGTKSEQVTKQIVEQAKKLYGLDKLVLKRYLIWFHQIATLDFGNSYFDTKEWFVPEGLRKY